MNVRFIRQLTERVVGSMSAQKENTAIPPWRLPPLSVSDEVVERYYAAASEGELRQVRELHAQLPYLYNYSRYHGFTRACACGHLEVAQYIHENSPMVETWRGYLGPYGAAHENGRAAVCRWLLGLIEKKC
jgi:hypothetical protein